MSYDDGVGQKDDVDRLFACFKCGVATPESALKERRRSGKKLKRANPAKGEASTMPGQQRVGSADGEKKHGQSTCVALKFRSGKHISPVVFYGSPLGAPIKRPSQLLRLLREIHVDLSEHNDLVPRQEIWATFPRQEEAMRFARTHRQVNIFSYQDHFSGQRRFLVSTYKEFWRRYKIMDSKVRHHYEVIQEGSPCHLYFDLEFDKRVNVGRDVDEMVDILIAVIFKTLYDKYSIEGNKEWVIELDSSTEGKFSRHLIIRIPRTAFKDNSHAGEFVFEVCKHIATSRGDDSQLDKLYVKKSSSSSDSPAQLFLDTAVYSRNRCFRLALSSKAGKNSYLLPTGRFKCRNLSPEQTFMESLICRMDVNCNKLLICKVDLDCKKTLSFDYEVPKQNHKLHGVTLDSCKNNFPSTYFSGKSPFPALELFIESIASIGDIPGKIRSWYWFSAEGLIIYNMLRNRYCERIGREHKSNHVMYVIDFQRAGYYQKCYDPDCKGYRSPLRPLPWDVVPDNTVLSESILAAKYGEAMNMNMDLPVDGNSIRQQSCNNGECITDSCQKDSSWWQEAMLYADCIEKTRVTSEISKLDESVMEDPEWWIGAEKIVSQLEEWNC